MWDLQGNHSSLQRLGAGCRSFTAGLQCLGSWYRLMDYPTAWISCGFWKAPSMNDPAILLQGQGPTRPPIQPMFWRSSAIEQSDELPQRGHALINRAHSSSGIFCILPDCCQEKPTLPLRKVHISYYGLFHSHYSSSKGTMDSSP